MHEHELEMGVSDPIDEAKFQQFSEDCRIEHEGDVTMIYDPTNTKRWYVYRYTDWENKDRLRLELEGLTGLAWHALMAVSQAKDATTGKELSTWVEIDVLEPDAYISSDKTGSKMHFYDNARGRVHLDGWSGGFGKELETVERELKGHHPVAITKDQLPQKINVKATGAALIKRFNEGRFDPPAFVLYPESLPTQRTPRIPSFLRRLFKKESTALQIDSPSKE